jgi:hypothetical protein
MAKECQAGIRDAKNLSFNRVKAIFSQQSSFRFLSSKQRILNVVNYFKSHAQ